MPRVTQGAGNKPGPPVRTSGLRAGTLPKGASAFLPPYLFGTCPGNMEDLGVFFINTCKKIVPPGRVGLIY